MFWLQSGLLEAALDAGRHAKETRQAQALASERAHNMPRLQEETGERACRLSLPPELNYEDVVSTFKAVCEHRHPFAKKHYKAARA
jgi:hypothetical protein